MGQSGDPFRTGVRGKPGDHKLVALITGFFEHCSILATGWKTFASAENVYHSGSPASEPPGISET
jgi:hypothetical protein